jgi:hypothetical protein
MKLVKLSCKRHTAAARMSSRRKLLVQVVPATMASQARWARIHLRSAVGRLSVSSGALFRLPQGQSRAEVASVVSVRYCDLSDSALVANGVARSGNHAD